jgi:SAM-dependent methyltransferase
MPIYSGHMPTITPGPAPFSAGESHKARQMAESFGLDAERYDRARPSYPPAMVERIVAGSPGRDVLDVGIGTGISARPFQAAGCRVTGVDVDDRMAEFARRQGFEVEVATFEEWRPGRRMFDLVIAGQAWHWVDPVAGPLKAAQVLRPSGRLAVFWNVFQFPADLSAAIAAVYRQVLPGSPFARGTSGGLAAYSGLATKAADGIRDAARFGPPEQWQFDWERLYTRDEWLDQVPTSGGHNQFPPGKLDELLEGTGAAIDAVGGRFTMSYVAVVVTAALADA